jgi:Tol biopolymer transport system component
MESLLRYQRPLVEDGSIEYDFVYVPGRFEAHPALDRLVFLLAPNGVRIHWLTDGKFDRSLVTPDHAVVEPENQRGPGQLPLKEYTWNHLKLSIEGQSVSLELNGQLIYERELESTNLRTFGLFRYGDRNELQVRDVRMRGDWPKSVPPLQEQEFADPQLVELETQLGELPAEFHHDFAIGGLPEKIFAAREPQLARFVTVEDDGVHVQFQAEAGWKNLALMPRFSLAGDFDVRAHFELQGHLDTQWIDGLAFLEVQLDDDESHSVRAMRGREPGGRQATRAQVMWGPIGEHRKLSDYSQTSWSRSGCLRIARVGDRLFSLFAPQDSSSFRVVHEEQVNDADVLMRGILLELAMRDKGRGHVIWKDLSICAERMKYLAPDQKPMRKLFSMSPDGSNLRELTAPKFGLDHLGSPEFSSDGSRTVLDMSKGPTTTSHIVSMNRDGSNLKDLGMGCMPSLSKDGKTIVFSDPGSGIVKMDADGENREIIEPAGWGAQFSPDGKYLAYGAGGNLTLLEIGRGKKTPALKGDAADRYSRIYWNFGWSHDSQAIAFKGQNRKTGAPELAVVDLNKPDRVEVLYSANGIYEDFTFSPDNRSVLFAMRETGLTQSDLYLVHRARPGRIERLEGQPDDFRILDCDWSPDGKTIIFAALVDPVPFDWPLEEESGP